ncbi:retroviral-like aspartic protease family protein [Limibacter armeniacum]|uniref:retroviral-like aspartic protease family protein n=1 Tax=Limibacter armeniacum TaxID=466084 RepID=UPI002FE624DC
MLKYKAFTLKSTKGLVRELKSHCHVSPGFDPKLIDPKTVRFQEFTALWDTGASGTVISKRAAQMLNLKPVGRIQVNHANGTDIKNRYLVNLFLPNEIGFSLVSVTEGVLQGFDLLIGMDVITRGDFSITNYEGKTTFSFRIPSMNEVDYVQEHEDLVKKSLKHVKRNDPCICKSGKKFKACCAPKYGLN